MELSHFSPEILFPVGQVWESGAQRARREREERIQRIRKQKEAQKQKEAPDEDDEGQHRQVKRQRPCAKKKINSGLVVLDNDEGQYRQVKRQRPCANNNNNRLLLPPGWLDCPAIGQPLLGFLIPSKVPLCDSFDDQITPAKRYSFSQVHRVLGRNQLGLVIDLTNSSRYYNPNELTKEGGTIRHVKIAYKGHDSVPDNESVNKFFNEVYKFQLTRWQTKKHVLVHCTHGHNRTGYMIVHYLMRTQQLMSVSQAIKLFADARPPGIYKPDYIDALYDFYHEKKPDSVLVCPPTPDWKRSCSNDDEDDRHSAPSPQQPVVVISTMSNDDVLGDKIPDDQEMAMQQFCLQVMGLSARGGRLSFPGSHPVSLNRDKLQLLRQCYYYATWKADGTRYMMLITMDGCYLIDRNFRFRRVQMRFPCIAANLHHHHYTLLDGEMVIDTVPGSQKRERRYLIYDMMAINGVSIVEHPFSQRWQMIERELIEPRNSERNPDYRFDLEPFRVRRKGFWLLSTVAKILKGFIPTLPHEADGLVFQGWDDCYVPRTHEGLLKWKYPEMNSVDFLFEMVGDRQLLFLFERGKKKPMDGRVVFPDGSDASDYAGKIVECSWDSERNVWVCMRVRVDKGTPNEFNTYQKVMRSIKDNITEEVLLNEIDEIVRLPMYADKIQNEISKLAQPKR